MPRLTHETKLIMDVNPSSIISEAYRNLKTSIQFSKWNDKLQVIAVASTMSGEGKTTTISNLAVSYAQEGKKVVLVDADLRRPSIHRGFALSNKVGLSNLLANQCTLDEVVRPTYIEHLAVIPSGPVPPNPGELLSSNQLNRMLDDLRESYDIILFDTPPLLAVADGVIVAALCDGVVLVVQVGKVKRQLIKKAKARLEHVNAQILGVVLNNQRKSKADYQYYE